jgi:hypothetical protein
MASVRNYSVRENRERGLKSESVVRNILKEMRMRGAIVRFFATGREDNKFKGIDFMIFVSDQIGVPLQVKSSLTGVINHRRKFPKVPAIIADAGNPAATKRRILAVLAFCEDRARGRQIKGDWFQACYCAFGKYFVLSGKPVSRKETARIAWNSRSGLRWRKCG